MRYEVKGFVKPHPDYEYDCCEDRFAINIVSRRFAVADGMTESYLSDYFANLLVNRYVSCQEEELIRPASFFTDERFGKEWEEHIKEKEKEVEGTIFEKRLKRKKNICRYAASTFAGISIYNETINYTVIGDCCIFGIDNNFNLQFVYPNVDKTGFNNAPSCITSDGNIKGEFINGCIPLFSGYIFLLTDAIAKWFLEQLNESKSSGEKLWDLSSHIEMVNFLNDEYDSNRLRADDVAIVAIHLIDDDLKLEDSILYSDNFDELLQKENAQEEIVTTNNLVSEPVNDSPNITDEAYDNYNKESSSTRIQIVNDRETEENETIYPQIIESSYQHSSNNKEEYEKTFFGNSNSSPGEKPTSASISTDTNELHADGIEDCNEMANCHSSLNEFSKDIISYNPSEEFNQEECCNNDPMGAIQDYQDNANDAKESDSIEDVDIESGEERNNFWKDMWGEFGFCKDFFREIKNYLFLYK